MEISQIQNKAEIIYDTDDDNLHLDNWVVPDFFCSRKIENHGPATKFFNIYNYFTNEMI